MSDVPIRRAVLQAEVGQTVMYGSIRGGMTSCRVFTRIRMRHGVLSIGLTPPAGRQRVLSTEGGGLCPLSSVTCSLLHD